MNISSNIIFTEQYNGPHEIKSTSPAGYSITIKNVKLNVSGNTNVNIQKLPIKDAILYPNKYSNEKSDC